MASPSPEGVRFFVTGASGFIGQRVVRLLDTAGAQVRRGTLNDNDGVGLPGIAVTVDLRDPAASAAAIDGSEVVIHLAARSGGIQLQESSALEVFQENHAITAGVLEGAAEAGAQRVFLASSGTVYADELRSPIPEHARLVGPDDRPSGYAWSKVCDEVLGGWYQAQGAFEVVIGRFTNVYGPGAPTGGPRATVIHDLIRKALAADPGGRLEVWGDGSAVRSFSFADDAALALVTIARAGTPGLAYNIDSGQAIAIAELASLIRDLVDPSLELVFDPNRPTGPAYRVLDPTRLLSLGHLPTVPLKQGLQRTIEGLRTQSAG